jgi:hypothetical protein
MEYNRRNPISKVELIVCVDDGHPLDLRVAEIFLKKGIKAIFYIWLHSWELEKSFSFIHFKIPSWERF